RRNQQRQSLIYASNRARSLDLAAASQSEAGRAFARAFQFDSMAVCRSNVMEYLTTVGRPEPWTDKLWVYDLRTNKHFTQKQSPITRPDFDEFVACYQPGAMHKRKPTWGEEN